MNILIIDQCSGAKEYKREVESLDAEALDAHSKEELLERPQMPARKARNLYAGRQQQYIDDAVDNLRATGDTVDRYFISAGFGVVEETELLPPYDVTFADYSAADIRERGDKLGIEGDLLNLVDNGYDIVFFAIGSDYARSFDLERVLSAVPAETWAVCFNSESVTESFNNALSLPARTEQAKEYGTIVVALKGHYLQQFAAHRSNGKQVADIADIDDFCTTEPTTQSGLDDLT